MSLEPFVPIAELAAPQALMTAIQAVIDANLTIAQNVLDFRNDAQADQVITAQQLALVTHPLLLGGA